MYNEKSISQQQTQSPGAAFLRTGSCVDKIDFSFTSDTADAAFYNVRYGGTATPAQELLWDEYIVEVKQEVSNERDYLGKAVQA